MENFDIWNKQKQEINKAEASKGFFNERDIVWVRCGLNVGIESDGKGEYYLRPALIIRKLNKNHFVVLFCTSTNKENKYYFKLSSKSKELKNTKVILTQVKCIDSKRIVEKMATIIDGDYFAIKKSFVDIINNSPSPFGEGETDVHK